MLFKGFNPLEEKSILPSRIAIEKRLREKRPVSMNDVAMRQVAASSLIRGLKKGSSFRLDGDKENCVIRCPACSAVLPKHRTNNDTSWETGSTVTLSF